MSISKYIREIGRGKDGARALNAEQAQDLMTQLLDGRVTDLEVGAFALAMRIKGETPAELAGFLAATQVHCLAPPSPQLPASAVLPVAPHTQVWLPSYNGARKLPNLSALLALLLAREGVPVLVHGLPEDPGRVTTAEVFAALGLRVARDATDIAAAWQASEPVFVPTARLCPPLAKLLAVRRVVGLRNSGHTVAKVLMPAVAGGAPTVFRVVNHTHPEYAGLLNHFLTETRADAMLLRGTEGEPVADARRTPRMDVFVGGQRSDALSVPARDGVLSKLPELPPVCDAASTAAYIAAVLQDNLPVPEPIALQVRGIIAATALRASAAAAAAASPATTVARPQPAARASGLPSTPSRDEPDHPHAAIPHNESMA